MEIMGTNPSHFEGDNLPVENVSWNDTQEFIQKLNVKTRGNYRLPTEAEWEFAARGGNNSVGYKYAGSDDISTVAWYYSNSGEEAHSVGLKLPNELGIYDMSGNVWEWCQDWYGIYSPIQPNNPIGAYSSSTRVLRGGSWLDNARNARIVDRGNGKPEYSDYCYGFRLAK
jgi:formylglycine-generating enzyme required for sulfatase activity